jgi:Zn-dependent protease with chaperone function
MSDTSLSYPLTPEKVDQQILQPSPEFKQEATKVVAAIVFFIVTYVLLVSAGLALAVLCAIGGFALMVFKPMFFTLMLGAGLIGLGALVFYFLIKFLFKQHRVDRSGLIELKESEHPRLFAFIRKLAAETQTTFPKKIYLSPEVNASVFYDSSFWSMFLPIRKNLLIGLGLVNTVNVSEFKAIIAHEFGHFSQRSMKLGSYVYNMNHIIFNMLFDNEGYERVIAAWAGFSSYFELFASLTVRIVKGIQWILERVYTIMNRPYMSLSRQMEFHADSVAASVSGGNHLITSLRRLEVADTTFNNVLSFYHENSRRGLKPENVFSQHKELMKLFAEVHDLPLEHGLPQVSASSFSKFNKARVIIKDQWASHPSTDDREAHLRSLRLETPAQHDSAWLLFDRHEELQRQVTEKIFSKVAYQTPVQLVDDSSFREQYREKFKEYELPFVYKGFFDSRLVSKTDLRDLEKRIDVSNETLDSILTEQVLALPHFRNGILADMEVVTEIVRGHLKVPNFEFNGKKFSGSDASAVHGDLERELGLTNKQIAEADEKLIAWFLSRASAEQREDLRRRYSELFLLSEQAEKDMDTLGVVQTRLMPLYQVMTFEQIEIAISVLKSSEGSYRERLAELLKEKSFTDLINDEERKRVDEYLSKDWQYFRKHAGVYEQDALELLNESLYVMTFVINERVFRAKAEILRLQLQYAGSVAEGVSLGV